MTQELTQEELTKVIDIVSKNSSTDGDVVYLGNILELKLVKDEETGNITTIDIYKYASQEEMEEDDYDFDGDYITSIYLK